LIERGVKHRDEIASALEEVRSADALLAIPGGVPSGHYEQMIRAAHRARRPTMFHARGESTRDALITYGTSEVTAARQAARLVDRILKGTPAGELAVERPTRLELTVNLKTAKALGLTIPQSLLLRADEVIQ